MGAIITLTTDFDLTDAYVATMKGVILGINPEAITSVVMLPLPHPYQAPDGSLVGHILHIDSFGNLITNIKSDDLPQPKQVISIEVGNQLIHGLSRTYAEGRGLLALIGSSGYLEVSLKGGSARALLNADVGNEVTIRQGGSQ